MLVLLPGMWFLGTGTVITNDLRGRDRPGTASMLAGLAVFVTVVLDLTLIPPFGVIGAAIASDCAYAAFGIASLVVLARIVGVPVRVLLPTLRDIGVYRQLFQSLVRRLRPPVRAVDTAA
jgi:Na+-driven multidrug efflux pump